MVNTKLYCENVSRQDIKQGWHINPLVKKTYLIQISDIGYKQPKALYENLFSDKLRLNFDDIEDELDFNSITDYQAEQIAEFLSNAKQNAANIIVHCHAGICRSGAVVEAAVSVGYSDVEGRVRIPNTLVKRKVMSCLGTYITAKNSAFAEDFYERAFINN